jgi:YD repeat-containing protein
MIDFAGVTRMTATYNQFGQLLTITGAEGLTSARSYDARGNLASLSVPGLPTMQRTSTLMDQTLTYTNPWGETRSFGYDALGRANQFPYGPGSASITKDLEGRVTATSVTMGTRVDTSAVSYASFSPTALAVNAVTVGASMPAFDAPPVPPPASCTPACALRCGAELGDTCGGLIDCACGSNLTCNDAGFCVE